MPEPLKTRKTSKAAQTRERIISAYLDLIPEKKWDKISVKDLCAKSDITRGTFYQYFNDIYDLMQHIQDTLIQELIQMYGAIPHKHPSVPMTSQIFEEKFNCMPPDELLCWFEFCKKNKKPMAVLLDPKNGDSYFVKKIKALIKDQINEMMDRDGMPHDGLRDHFLKIFIELHFLSARTWLDAKDGEFLSVNEIINLLNTMRVGANYLHYKQATVRDFNVPVKYSDADFNDESDL